MTLQGALAVYVPPMISTSVLEGMYSHLRARCEDLWRIPSIPLEGRIFEAIKAILESYLTGKLLSLEGPARSEDPPERMLTFSIPPPIYEPDLGTTPVIDSGTCGLGKVWERPATYGSSRIPVSKLDLLKDDSVVALKFHFHSGYDDSTNSIFCSVAGKDCEGVLEEKVSLVMNSKGLKVNAETHLYVDTTGLYQRLHDGKGLSLSVLDDKFIIPPNVVCTLASFFGVTATSMVEKIGGFGPSCSERYVRLQLEHETTTDWIDLPDSFWTLLKRDISSIHFTVNQLGLRQYLATTGLNPLYLRAHPPAGNVL